MKDFLRLTPDTIDSEMAKFELPLSDLHLNARDGISLLRALEAYHATLPDRRGDTHKPVVAERIRSRRENLFIHGEDDRRVGRPARLLDRGSPTINIQVHAVGLHQGYAHS